MPKIVDPVERRRQIFEALFDVIAESGVEQASLARVAQAAGLAIGSVRHYFGSHGELLSGAATEIIERTTARLTAHLDRLHEVEDRRSLAAEMLCELLPLDERRRREVTVWLEFAMAARTNEALQEPAGELFSGSRKLAAVVIERTALFRGRQAELETERLTALIDGLALRGILAPGSLPPALARATVERHIKEL